MSEDIVNMWGYPSYNFVGAGPGALQKVVSFKIFPGHVNLLDSINLLYWFVREGGV